MNKKRFLIMFVSLIVIGLTISTYQYVEMMKTDVASAAQTIPNPGHSWSSMESGPDSIQVTGKTITNLATPVASSDAVNKAYVDAAGSSTYAVCYALQTSSACLSGWTTVASYNSSSYTWSFGGVLGGITNTSAVATQLGVGGGMLNVLFDCGTGQNYPRGTNGACGTSYGGYMAYGNMVNQYNGFYMGNNSMAFCCK
jgi:hypothetical protein